MVAMERERRVLLARREALRKELDKNEKKLRAALRKNFGSTRPATLPMFPEVVSDGEFQPEASSLETLFAWSLHSNFIAYLQRNQLLVYDPRRSEAPRQTSLVALGQPIILQFLSNDCILAVYFDENLMKSRLLLLNTDGYDLNMKQDMFVNGQVLQIECKSNQLWAIVAEGHRIWRLDPTNCNRKVDLCPRPASLQSVYIFEDSEMAILTEDERLQLYYQGKFVHIFLTRLEDNAIILKACIDQAEDAVFFLLLQIHTQTLSLHKLHMNARNGQKLASLKLDHLSMLHYQVVQDRLWLLCNSGHILIVNLRDLTIICKQAIVGIHEASRIAVLSHNDCSFVCIYGGGKGSLQIYCHRI